MGPAHPHIYALADAAIDIEDTSLEIVYEPDTRLHATIREHFGEIPITTDLNQAMACRPNLALSGAVPAQRSALVERALCGGASVLVDKPLALSHESLDRLVATQQKFQRPVIAYYPSRGDPYIVAAMEQVRDGVIGSVVRVFSSGPHKIHAGIRPDWHWTRQGNGGALIDIGSHHVDICCLIAGGTPCWISALHVNRSQPGHTEFQDFAQGQMVFPNSVLAHFEVDWLQPNSTKSFGDTQIWILGTQGKIEVRLGDQPSCRLWTNDVAGVDLPLDKYPKRASWERGLIDDLLCDRTCAISQEDVWRASRLTLYAFDSAQNAGTPIKIAI